VWRGVGVGVLPGGYVPSPPAGT